LRELTHAHEEDDQLWAKDMHDLLREIHHEVSIEHGETRFVEIGPLFSFTRNLATHLLPFDEISPMGWGYDRVWPVVTIDIGLTMGIIDCISVDHSYRPQGVSYSKKENKITMNKYLEQHNHLKWREARRTVRSFFS